METITFYSYKGGSGRTLLVANVARYIASLGKRVIAIDFDLEAPGLHYKLHSNPRTEKNDHPSPKLGVVDYLLSITNGSEKDDINIRDYLLPVPLPHGTNGELFLMPAGSAPTGAYWKSLTTLRQHEHIFFSDSDGFGIAACLLELKVRLEEDVLADYLLIDSRTGITELSGLTTTLLADKVVCIMIDNDESLSGTRRVLRSLLQAPRLNGQESIILFPVLSRVDYPTPPFGDILDYLNKPLFHDDQQLGLKRLFFLHTDRKIAVSDSFVDKRIRETPCDKHYFDLLWALVPADNHLVALAAKRVMAIPAMKAWLTGTDGMSPHEQMVLSFDKKQIEEGIEIGSLEKRYADLVVYSSHDRTEIFLVSIFVDDLASSQDWQWWEAKTSLRCVILFTEQREFIKKTRIFTRGRKSKKFIERDEYAVQQIIRWPISYSLLDDPGECSVERMLRVVQNGGHEFVDLLVEEWQLSSYLTFGAYSSHPYDPSLARKIFNGLADVTDPETEKRILYQTAPFLFGPHESTNKDNDDQIFWKLHVPLWWRFSVNAKIGLASSVGYYAKIMSFLAHDLMGLTFDQDESFRRDVEKIIELLPNNNAYPQNLIKFYPLLRKQRLKFQLSDNAPPELIRHTVLFYTLEVQESQDAESIWERAKNISQEHLEDAKFFARLFPSEQHMVPIVIQNFLGTYDPETCQVTLFSKPIQWTASILKVDERALANVVFIHEAVYAMCHLGQDLDGCIWEDFGLPSANSINYRPSLLLETLANYFTNKMICRLEDQKMMLAFQRLDECQPVEYQSWRDLQHIHVEEVRKILIKARNGMSTLSGLRFDR